MCEICLHLDVLFSDLLLPGTILNISQAVCLNQSWSVIIQVLNSAWGGDGH